MQTYRGFETVLERVALNAARTVATQQASRLARLPCVAPRQFAVLNAVIAVATVLGWGPATQAWRGGVFLKDPGMATLVGESMGFGG